MDTNGKPLAGAVVTPTGYYAEDRGRREAGGPALSIALPEWEQARCAAKTDANGRFKLIAPPGYSVDYRVKMEASAETRWIAPAGVELETKLFVTGTVAVTAAGIDPARLKGTRITLSDRTPAQTSPGVSPSRYSTGVFDTAGKASIPGVVPGQYKLSFERHFCRTA